MREQRAGGSIDLNPNALQARQAAATYCRDWCLAGLEHLPPAAVASTQQPPKPPTHQRCAARCTGRWWRPTAGPHGPASRRPAGWACVGGSAPPTACGGAPTAPAPGAPWRSSSASRCGRRCRAGGWREQGRVGGRTQRGICTVRLARVRGRAALLAGHRAVRRAHRLPYPLAHCVDASRVPSQL